MRVNISYGRKDGKRLMKLSVIIVSYENCEILRDCLDSIKKFNDLKDEAEIIISDNSITNSVYEMVKKDYPEIQIIKEIRVRKDYEISITLNASFNQVEQLKAVSTYDGAEIFEEISEKGA